jgi:pantoate--beta-alanine ligase
MKVITDAAGLHAVTGGLFVPTMGALHEGHLTLVRKAAEHRARLGMPRPVIVSIFVNPTQFNDPKDLDRYPRTLEADLAGCERAGADAVFAPSPEVIYPPGQTIPTPTLPPVATEPKLDDAYRPGHFAGVCQVVKRLFDLVKPAAAFFGEKDWQQLQVITAMTLQERMPVEIVPVPTIREKSGLAMSSRNVFLVGRDRQRADAISQALFDACAHKTPAEAERAMRATLARHGIEPEYAVVRDSRTLLPVSGPSTHPMRALIAARVGPVRLIDNCAWPG